MKPLYSYISKFNEKLLHAVVKRGPSLLFLGIGLLSSAGISLEAQTVVEHIDDFQVLNLSSPMSKGYNPLSSNQANYRSTSTSYPSGSSISINGKVYYSSKDTLVLTLDQVIAMAQEQSPAAQSAKHAFLAAQWQYKYYRANYLPSLTLESSPYLNRQINKITLGDGTSTFIRQNQLITDLSLSINQNIALTGGSLFLNTSLSRLDEFENDRTAYNSQPLTIGYKQSLFGYNSLKWDRKIEPVKYREAQKNYREAMELVAANVCKYFFALVEAQTNLEMARLNYASADTLYQMGQGRYKIGTINQNDMLQLEINRLNEETACMDNEVQVNNQTQQLLTYLHIEGTPYLSLVIPETVPMVQVSLEEALALAQENASDLDYYRRIRLESESNVAMAKANAGLRAELYMQFGLSQTDQTLAGSYRHPLHQEYVSVTLSLPILDWGRGKGRVKVAQSQRDMVFSNAQQGENDFRQNITKLVMQMNMQPRKVDVASRTNELASHRYDIARRLYISGRNTILDLNVAQSEKDSATRTYISSLSTFWTLYYTLRSICGPEIMSLTKHTNTTYQETTSSYSLNSSKSPLQSTTN